MSMYTCILVAIYGYGTGRLEAGELSYGFLPYLHVRFAHAYSRRAARVRPPALFVRPPRFCLAASFTFCSCAGAKSAAVPGFQLLRCTGCPGQISGAERIERFSGSFSAKTLRVRGLACPRARLAVWAGSAPRAPPMSAICGSPWSEVTRRQCAGCPCLWLGRSRRVLL